MATPGQMFDVRVLGDAKLSATLNALEPSIVKPALRVALRDGFKLTLARVKQAVPRGTGRMARALKLRAANLLRGSVAFRIFLPKRTELGLPWVKKLGSRGGNKRNPGYYPAHLEFGYDPSYKGPATVTERYYRRTSRQGNYEPYSYTRKSRSKGPQARRVGLGFMRGSLHATAEAVKTRVRRRLWTEVRANLRERVGGAS